VKALLLIDLQNDFVPGGALAVPHGDEVVPVANRLQPLFPLVVATQDWHPPDHGSFAANHPGKKPGDRIDLNGLEQILWPVHCVQNTPGAAFIDAFETARVSEIFHKGTDPGIDSYSGFFDNAQRKSTGLADYLWEQVVDEVYIAGLATDYCAKSSALDAVELGFKTHLVEDGCRGVELQPGDVERALQEMREAGVILLRSTDLIATLDPVG
jgi:nicotinamidase/pyrazinamidase